MTSLPFDETSQVEPISYRIPYDLPDRKKWNGLVLVGEAAGADEVRLGRPFVGRSGQLLNNMLASAGIERANCLIANVFCVRPPNNKVDHFFASKRTAKEQNISINEALGKFGSSFCREEFSSEIDNLKDMMADWKPSIIIALGRTPFWALTGVNGLLSQVGKKFECRLLKTATVIPTFHPSFILRGNWKLQDIWREHFLMARQLTGKN